MDKRRIVCKVWLALGFIQLAFLVSGCSGTAYSDDNLLSTSPARERTTDEGSSQDSQLPQRLSRAYFERSLTGSITLNDHEILSDVEWVEEYPQDRPARSIPSIGTDHIGCATYTNVDGIQLCFNIMGDVSSVGLSAKDISLRGACRGKVQNARFERASNKDGVVIVKFKLGCDEQGGSLKITLRQV